MSYKSPIEIIQGIQEKLNYDFENKVHKAVMECNINVNKDELFKALKYDREQYDKGYRDGFLEGRKKAKEEILNYLSDGLKNLIENYGEEVVGEEISFKHHTLMDLPCKVGDKLYLVYSPFGDIDEWEITDIQIGNVKLFRLGHKGTDDYAAVLFKELGEVAFLNKTEAEKKQEELRSKY